MSDLRRVPLPSSRTDRYVGRLIAGVAVAVLLAVMKPWGGDNPRQPGAAVVLATPTSTPTPTPTPSPTPGPKSYDFLAWGTNEPPPSWELWPAGRLASFSFAMRIDVAPQVVATAAPSVPEGSFTPSDTALAAPSPAVVPGVVPRIPETWPKVDIPRGTSLELVAVNHPREYEVQIVGLSRLNPDGTEVAVHAITGPSPWPAHFTIVGLASGVGSGGMEPWPTGRYTLDIRIMPGAVDRSIEIVVEPGAVPSAAPSSAP
jgi:hypothetical protein